MPWKMQEIPFVKRGQFKRTSPREESSLLPQEVIMGVAHYTKGYECMEKSIGAFWARDWQKSDLHFRQTILVAVWWGVLRLKKQKVAFKIQERRNEEVKWAIAMDWRLKSKWEENMGEAVYTWHLQYTKRDWGCQSQMSLTFLTRAVKWWYRSWRQTKRQEQTHLPNYTAFFRGLLLKKKKKIGDNLISILL